MGWTDWYLQVWRQVWDYRLGFGDIWGFVRFMAISIDDLISKRHCSVDV
jgi:hypothetical protein